MKFAKLDGISIAKKKSNCVKKLSIAPTMMECKKFLSRHALATFYAFINHEKFLFWTI